jgi:hypothetical protein
VIAEFPKTRVRGESLQIRLDARASAESLPAIVRADMHLA